MPQIFLGILALVIALWALNVVSKVDPKIAARVTKAGGGLLALGFAIFLGLRGEIGVALPLG
ncbi:MAG: molecular chaperone DnaJ, partial [Pseudolabrys sp.]|nr:molecular chaperone DnaJ [Pseudolabrys sp.]